MKTILKSEGGTAIFYAVRGDPAGLPLLVQHGLIASIEDSGLFDLLIHAGVKVVSPARPGYGDSSPVVLGSYAAYADWAAPLIHELGLTQFDVLGMSSGAPYSYALGAKLPKQVQNIYILSGMPALFDEEVLKAWPYPPIHGKSVEELEPLAKEIFFSWVSETTEPGQDVRDSMSHNCFGVAQDLRLRFMDWGFSLADVRAPVFMRHSREDDSVPVQTAIRTAELLPDCTLQLTETGPHFSPETLNDFIQTTILKNILLRGR